MLSSGVSVTNLKIFYLKMFIITFFHRQYIFVRLYTESCELNGDVEKSGLENLKERYRKEATKARKIWNNWIWISKYWM